MPINPEINMDRRALEDICRRHGIRRLAVFGSATRGDLGPDIELRTYEDLSRFFRDEVRASAEPIYGAA